MTAMPCGQKNNTREISHSQTVTPPLAAMEGTTFRLKTATTNSSTRSQRPRTRLRWGPPSSLPGRRLTAIWAAFVVDDTSSLAHGHGQLLLLGLGQCRRNLGEDGQVLVYIGLGVGDADGPLLVPPVGLRHDTAVH